MSILRKFFGSRNDREIRRIQIIVDQINLLENSMKKLGDDELRSKTDDFKSRIKEGMSLDEIFIGIAFCNQNLRNGVKDG